MLPPCSITKRLTAKTMPGASGQVSVSTYSVPGREVVAMEIPLRNTQHAVQYATACLDGSGPVKGHSAARMESAGTDLRAVGSRPFGAEPASRASPCAG